MLRTALLALLMLFGTPANADVFDSPNVVCLDEAGHIKTKFVTLLDAASRRDYQRFSLVNGSNRFKAPKFVFLNGGTATVSDAFEEWADYASPAREKLSLLHWQPAFKEGEGPKLAFFARIMRRKWNVVSAQSDLLIEEYLIIGTRCDLYLIQETDLPNWQLDDADD